MSKLNNCRILAEMKLKINRALKPKEYICINEIKVFSMRKIYTLSFSNSDEIVYDDFYFDADVDLSAVVLDLNRLTSCDPEPDDIEKVINNISSIRKVRVFIGNIDTFEKIDDLHVEGVTGMKFVKTFGCVVTRPKPKAFEKTKIIVLDEDPD